MTSKNTVNRKHNGNTTAEPGAWARPQLIDPEVLATLVGGITSRLDRAIVWLLIESGLRGSELVQLNRGKISLDSMGAGGRGEAVVAKSQGTRPFRIGLKTLEALGEYLSVDRDKDSNAALFVDKQGNRITVSYLRKMLCRWCDRLGTTRLTVHQFRHNFLARNATHAIRSQPRRA